jgi:hypothetical protein
MTINTKDIGDKMKKKVQHLEQLFDYAASKLTVYKGSDGRLMVAELINEGRGGYGRIYSLETLFRGAETFINNLEEERHIKPLHDRINLLEEKIKKHEDRLNVQADNHYRLSERKPRFGWK